jgi:L-rhamnose isomerase
LEAENDLTARLALLEEIKTLPLGSIWDFYCMRQNCATEGGWLREVRLYEKSVLSQRV